MKTLEEEGYEVETVVANPLSRQPRVIPEERTFSEPAPQYTVQPHGRRSSTSESEETAYFEKQEKHRRNCEQCQFERGELAPQLPDLRLPSNETEPNLVKVDGGSDDKPFSAMLMVGGMTCASCVGTITEALRSKPWVESANVNLLTKTALVDFYGKEHIDQLVPIIEDLGFEATLGRLTEPSPMPVDNKTSSLSLLLDRWKATYSIGGMTCSSCVSNITQHLQGFRWIKKADINLVGGSGVVVFDGRHRLDEIAPLIEELGYEASLESVTGAGRPHTTPGELRTVLIRIDGMYCEHCPEKILEACAEAGDVKVDEMPTMTRPIMKLTYVPNSPRLSIRRILLKISKADPAFRPSLHRPISIEERARKLHAREQKQILMRLVFAVIVAIPTFLIGILFMSLISHHNPSRQYLMTLIGGVSRAEWALFVMATPVYFFGADLFHRRMIKEVTALWRRRSPTPILQRFYRFGSMNMLISLGTTIAYVSSIGELIAAIVKRQSSRMNAPENTSYFDSVVFLTMFLLIGRYLEAFSKAKTGDAVAALGKLRPTSALLQAPDSYVTENGRFLDGFTKVKIDLLDRGDIVRVPNGSSPPCDGIVIAGSTTFDESSLTGESKPVSKEIDDQVFAGTFNKGPAISVRVTGGEGSAMLDRIIMVVREGQTRRAPMERVADWITGYFVPFICLIAFITWFVWLGLGSNRRIPLQWRDTSDSWAFWSLQFAIAVFVVACPCGIGLAAPTALFVGGGLAAKLGILVKGGGEAFQEASNLDCIVFDKTGTLTEGGEPSVTNFEHIVEYPDVELGLHNILALIKAVEQDSSHPLAKAVVNYCDESEETAGSATRKDTSEVPGRGIRGTATLPRSTGSLEPDVEVLVGNEKFMQENGALISSSTARTLDLWKRQGQSVVVAALKMNVFHVPNRTHGWRVVAIFGISDCIRADAGIVVHALQEKGIDVWMISGDNPTTANAIGKMLGIHAENIIAGVLPEQKAQKIKMLQSGPSTQGNKRATVAMVGDGINDSPALAAADVGIAIGSGSDVAIDAASFILMKSDLIALLKLVDLSRVVFRRIKFNFFWALVYNLIALPIAAGVLFPITTSGGSHIRLDPAWAALAMALSSVSVVCSSLLLNTRLPLFGFKWDASKYHTSF